MSALPSKADMDHHDHNVCFVPLADICSAANNTGEAQRTINVALGHI